MTKRRGSRGARKRRGSRGAHRKGGHGGQRHRRSAEAKQRRAAKWTTKLRGRLRGRVARLPIRRVLLGNGVRLCPQCPLPADRDGFLERAVRDVAARVGGTPHRRVTSDGRSVKPPGKHACCEVWEVRLPEGVAVVPSPVQFSCALLVQTQPNGRPPSSEEPRGSQDRTTGDWWGKGGGKSDISRHPPAGTGRQSSSSGTTCGSQCPMRWPSSHGSP